MCTPEHHRLRRSEDRMKTAWRYGALAGLLMVSVAAGPGAYAGSYPEKVVEMLADSAAGSTPDVALRFVAEELSKSWRQQVLVVNRPGAGGSLVCAKTDRATAPT